MLHQNPPTMGGGGGATPRVWTPTPPPPVTVGRSPPPPPLGLGGGFLGGVIRGSGRGGLGEGGGFGFGFWIWGSILRLTGRPGKEHDGFPGNSAYWPAMPCEMHTLGRCQGHAPLSTRSALGSTPRPHPSAHSGRTGLLLSCNSMPLLRCRCSCSCSAADCGRQLTAANPRPVTNRDAAVAAILLLLPQPQHLSCCGCHVAALQLLASASALRAQLLLASALWGHGVPALVHTSTGRRDWVPALVHTSIGRVREGQLGAGGPGGAVWGGLGHCMPPRPSVDQPQAPLHTSPCPPSNHTITLWGRFRTTCARRGHSANYYVVYPGNTPENHPPTERRMHDQFKTAGGAELRTLAHVASIRLKKKKKIPRCTNTSHRLRPPAARADLAVRSDEHGGLPRRAFDPCRSWAGTRRCSVLATAWAPQRPVARRLLCDHSIPRTPRSGVRHPPVLGRNMGTSACPAGRCHTHCPNGAREPPPQDKALQLKV